MATQLNQNTTDLRALLEAVIALPEAGSGEGSGGEDGTVKSIIDRTLTDIELPSGLTKIGDYAFAGMSNLNSVSIPNGVTSIGVNAFLASSIKTVSLPNTLTVIDRYAFGGCANLSLESLPSNLTIIDSLAFSGCTSLALTSLPEGITNIGSNAFRDCAGLTTLTFEGTPTFIGASAFGNCPNLTTINVPWAEGEVANAPWGATNATINYNYTEGTTASELDAPEIYLDDGGEQ